MVTEQEIERISKMMKIKITNHHEYIDKAHAMIDFFDVLDSADVNDVELDIHQIPLGSLRKDEYIPFDGRLISCLKSYRGDYIQSPKVS